MVFFCCNGCGDTLKKQKVEVHSYSCRASVSCIDCNVNFQGNDYKKHTKCVTEAERYQGTLYEAKENKGTLKQNSWMDSVREAAESCRHNPQLKGVLVRIAQNDNVPRKKAKFLNFIRNSMKVGNKSLVEQAWDEIEKAGKPKSTESDYGAAENNSTSEKLDKKRKLDEDTENVETNTITKENENSTKKHKKKKLQRVPTDNESQSVEPNNNHVNGITPETPGKNYKISSHIQELVFKKGDISVKKLKRKVTAVYLQHHPHKSPENAAKLFDRKVMKVAGVAIENGVASKENLDLAVV